MAFTAVIEAKTQRRMADNQLSFPKDKPSIVCVCVCVCVPT